MEDLSSNGRQPLWGRGIQWSNTRLVRPERHNLFSRKDKTASLLLSHVYHLYCSREQWKKVRRHIAGTLPSSEWGHSPPHIPGSETQRSWMALYLLFPNAKRSITSLPNWLTMNKIFPGVGATLLIWLLPHKSWCQSPPWWAVYLEIEIFPLPRTEFLSGVGLNMVFIIGKNTIRQTDCHNQNRSVTHGGSSFLRHQWSTVFQLMDAAFWYLFTELKIPSNTNLILCIHHWWQWKIYN